MIPVITIAQDDIHGVIDSFTKCNCFSKSIVLCNRTWDSRILINVFLSKKDLRNPLTSEKWSDSEIDQVRSLMNESEKNVFDVMSISESNQPRYVISSVKTFLEEQATVCVFGILALTEEFVVNENGINDMQKKYDELFNEFRMYMCGLVHVDPVMAGKCAVSFINRLKHDSEGKILQGMITRTIDLLTNLLAGIEYSRSSDEIIQTLSQMKNLRIVFSNLFL